ncbi:MAG: hypothetical protein AAGF95_34725 [Chloroflexota bacterium]
MRGVVMHWRVVFVGLIGLVLVCGCAAEPQHLSWPEQLERLQARARWEDREALLYLCIATEPESYNETLTLANDESLTISCDFMRPDGTTFRLRYDDLRVRGTLELTSVRGELEQVDPIAMRTLQNAQGDVQIGPRAALVAAQPHSVQFREKAGPLMFSTVILHVGEFSMQRANLPAIWSVLHYSFSEEREQIWVSALDGTVIEREETEE